MLHGALGMTVLRIGSTAVVGCERTGRAGPLRHGRVTQREADWAVALTKRQRLIRFLEFLVIGVAMGLLEDLLAVALATDASIDARVVLIVLIVALPFAVVSELVVDHPRFWERLMPRAWFPSHWVRRDNTATSSRNGDPH